MLGFLPTILSILGDGRRWGHVDGVHVDLDLACCRGFFSRFLGPFRLFRELRCGVSFWLCRPLVVFILELTIWVLFVMLVDCLSGCRGAMPFELVDDGDLLLLIDHMLRVAGVLTLFVFLRLRAMLMMAWFFMDRFVGRIS